jgi:hypothetical protein
MPDYLGSFNRAQRAQPQKLPFDLICYKLGVT